MSSSIERIKRLVTSLPEKDIKLAENFINKRDFESLQELVDSARYKVRKSQSSDNPRPEYASINLGKLSELKGEVDSYVLALTVPESDNTDWDDVYMDDLEDIL